MGLTNAELGLVLTTVAGSATALGAAVVFSERLVQLASKPFLAGALGLSSGVMLYATSKKAAAAAQICFQERRVQKEYLALVWGTPPSRELACAEPICQSTEDAFKMMIGDVDAVWPLLDQDASKADRDERRRKRKHSGPAATTVLELARGSYMGEPVAKLLLKPTSGRRHQLRLHCVALGLPIVGDATYGADDGAPRMMLHARTLRLPVG